MYTEFLNAFLLKKKEQKMSQYKFSKPKKVNDWYIFPDTVLANINLSGCENTVNGVCHNTKNVEECIDICQKSGKCRFGYFIQTPDANFCAPLLHHEVGSVAPYYRLRNKDIYPGTKNTRSFVFSDGKKYPFLPDMPNALFYADYFSVKN